MKIFKRYFQARQILLQQFKQMKKELKELQEQWQKAKTGEKGAYEKLMEAVKTAPGSTSSPAPASAPAPAS